LHGHIERNLWRMPKNMVFEMLPVIKTGTPFRGIGDLVNYIGLLVCGGFIVLYALKEIVKEIIEYVYTWRNTGKS
jgi:hypothetical protein